MIFGMSIQSLHVETDNKELRKKINNALNNLNKEISLKLAGVKSCENGFSPSGYLRAVASGNIFTPEKQISEMPQPGEDADSLLQRALQREQEAIVLFLALRDSLTDPADKKAVEDLVREEMSHISFLQTKKSELSN